MTETPLDPDRDELQDLLDRWEVAREQGRTLTAAELCRDRPNLLAEVARRIAALERMGWMEADPAPDPVPPPESVGRYRVRGLLGEGGYGRVWRAYDPDLDREVALKLPLPHRAGPGAVDALLAEARRAAGLKHPHVVPVYDVGRHDGGVYVVSQLIDGPTLDEYAAAVPRTRAGLRSLAILVAQVADALACAHAHGVLHRDVKPGNVLVGPDGSAYLTDFGLAATAAGSEGPAGTLAYTAPELLDGTSAADGRSEVYGLGVVLYEVLTGARAFPGATASEVRARVLAGQPARPRSVVPSIPAPLEAVCLRAMATDPADRHPTVEDFSKALRRAATPTPWPRVVAVLGGLVVLLIGGVAIGGYGLSKSNDFEPVAAGKSVQTEEVASPPGESSPPPRTAPATPPGVSTLTPTHTLAGHKGPVGVLRFTPDGGTLYTSDWGAILRRWDARTWRPLSPDVGAGWPDQRLTSDLALTADGRRAICLYSGKLQEVELATGTVVRSFTPPLTAPHGRNQQVALSPDGKWLAAGDDDVVRLWDFTTGAVVWYDPEAARSKSRALAFAPDGVRLLVANRFGPATVYTPDSPRPSRLPAHWNSLRAAAFFPDGKRAVLAGDDRGVRVWDVSALPPRVVHVLTGPRPSVQAVAVARAGRYVLAVGDDGVLHGWDADTGKQAFVTDPGGGIQGVAVGPDGATAVTGHRDGSVRVWTVPQ